jgi:SAM-dependent methyltransferase
MGTDTAHRAWNDNWSSAEGRADWLVPEADVIAVAEQLKEKHGKLRVLDLGCGVGRHALHFARLGFETVAIDMAEAGLAELRANADREAVIIETRLAPMTALPFEDGAFDYVLAFNVIYHGDPDIVGATVAEIRRVLRAGGTYQGTMLSKRNAGNGVGTEVAPNTFIRTPEPGAAHEADKSHPHFYCNAGELVALFEGFELVSLFDREHAKPGSWHWHMVAERMD